MNSLLIKKDPDSEKDRRQKEKRVTEDEMVVWYHRLNGHELGHILGDGEGQSMGHERSDTTWRLNTNK